MSFKFIVLMLAQAGASTPEGQKSVYSIGQYHDCISSTAVKYEKAGESASDTVDAAIASCRYIRNGAIKHGQESRPPNSVISSKTNSDLLVSLWDTALEIEREKALVTIIEIRLKRKGNK